MRATKLTIAVVVAVIVVAVVVVNLILLCLALFCLDIVTLQLVFVFKTVISGTHGLIFKTRHGTTCASCWTTQFLNLASTLTVFTARSGLLDQVTQTFFIEHLNLIPSKITYGSLI